MELAQDLRKLRNESFSTEINFDDQPISQYPQLPPPKLLKELHQQFGSGCKYQNNRESNSPQKFDSSQMVLKTPSTYRKWANNYVANSKETLGEGFGEGVGIKNKQRNRTVRVKRDNYGLIQCTQSQMELMWANKTKICSLSKITLSKK